MSQIGDRFDTFRTDMLSSEEQTKELHDRTEKVKLLIDQYDNIWTELSKVEKQWEDKSKGLYDVDKVKNLKEAITKIKKDLFGMNVQIGVYRGHILREKVKEGGEAFEMFNKINIPSHPDNYEDDSFEI